MGISDTARNTWQLLPTEMKLAILQHIATLPSCASVSRDFNALVTETIRHLDFQLAAQCPEWQEEQQSTPRGTPLTMARFRELTTQLRSEMTDAEYRAISQKYPNPFSVEHVKAVFAQVQKNRDAIPLLALWDRISPSLPTGPVPLPHRDVAAIRAWMADPRTLSQRQEIRFVNLSGLQLRVIPPELGWLPQLERLNLSNNKIGVIPPELCQLAQLQSLNLSNNEIRVIPQDIGRPTQLQWLDLNNNEIRVIPPELGQLTQLEMLNLSNNEIGVIPSQFARLIALTILDTSGNPIGALTPDAARQLAIST